MQTSLWKFIAKALLVAGTFAGLGILSLTQSTPTAASELPTAQPAFGFSLFLPFINVSALDPVEATGTPECTSTPEVSPTPTPTSTDSSTPAPTPSPTPSATCTPQATPPSQATPTPQAPADGIPYGPFHNSDLTRPYFNSSFISGAEWNQMPQVRALGLSLFAAAGVSDPCYYLDDETDPDSFNVSRILADIEARHAQIVDYASDGTLGGIMELNEPHDPTRCDPIPAHFLVEIAQGFWQLFAGELSPETFYFGIDAPPVYLEDANDGSINLGFLQYTAKGGQDFYTWSAPLLESAYRQGMTGIIYSANLNILGVEAATQANILECAQPDALMVTLWTDRFVDESDSDLYADVLAACEAAAP
jgi:hypothetical protein